MSAASVSERIEQINLRRAKSALGCARKVRDRKEPKLSGDYLNAVEQFPFAARTLGLGQALAILCANGAKDNGKQHPGHAQLYADLQFWLCREQDHSPYFEMGEGDLLAALTNGSQGDYRSALIETEAYFAWLKPFAQAFLSDAKGGAGT